VAVTVHAAVCYFWSGRIVLALHAMEWEAEVVGTWAAAKALSVDSWGLVLLIPFMVSTPSYENFGCSFGNHFFFRKFMAARQYSSTKHYKKYAH
jgi:hypothetical protein